MVQWVWKQITTILELTGTKRLLLQNGAIGQSLKPAHVEAYDLDAFWKVVKQGVWYYDGAVLCNVCILEHNWFYGSGDYEDPPEFREDREGIFFYIEFGSTIERGVYSSRSGGGYASCDEAVAAATIQTNNTVVWQEE